MYSVTLCFPL